MQIQLISKGGQLVLEGLDLILLIDQSESRLYRVSPAGIFCCFELLKDGQQTRGSGAAIRRQLNHTICTFAIMSHRRELGKHCIEVFGYLEQMDMIIGIV